MGQKKKSALQRGEDHKLICCDTDSMADIFFTSLIIESFSYIYPSHIRSFITVLPTHINVSSVCL
jgi:hypothetical protein